MPMTNDLNEIERVFKSVCFFNYCPNCAWMASLLRSSSPVHPVCSNKDARSILTTEIKALQTIAISVVKVPDSTNTVRFRGHDAHRILPVTRPVILLNVVISDHSVQCIGNAQYRLLVNTLPQDFCWKLAVFIDKHRLLDEHQLGSNLGNPYVGLFDTFDTHSDRRRPSCGSLRRQTHTGCGA
jgi:hypothetical protein